MDNKPKKGLAVEMAKLSILEGSYKETTVRNVEQKWNVIFCDSAKCNISEKIYLIWHAYFQCFFFGHEFTRCEIRCSQSHIRIFDVWPVI